MEAGGTLLFLPLRLPPPPPLLLLVVDDRLDEPFDEEAPEFVVVDVAKDVAVLDPVVVKVVVLPSAWSSVSSSLLIDRVGPDLLSVPPVAPPAPVGLRVGCVLRPRIRSSA